MSRKVYWHLPGFCVYFYLNQVIIDLMQEYSDKFNDGYEAGSVYGTFPGAIWNGGRAVFGTMPRSNMKAIIDTYNRMGTPVRFTWTNSLIEEKHLYDTYCNMIMELADNGMNQVLCNSAILEKYLREHYNGFKYISSTTKRLTDISDFMEELAKDYFMVVLDYDLNHNEELLSKLQTEASRIEILVDEICYPNCPKRAMHYKAESLQQLMFEKGKPFKCPNFKVIPSFKECKKRPAFISKEEINGYIDKGFENFKLVGRGLPMEMVIDSYMYYLVKDGEEEFIKNRLKTILNKLSAKY